MKRTGKWRKGILAWVSAALALLLLTVPLISFPGQVKAGINSWSPVTFPFTLKITSLALSPAFSCDKTVFVGTDGDGVFRTVSGDSDPTWLPINNGLTDLGVLVISISPNYGRCDRLVEMGDRTLFVGTRNGIFRSTNGGATWELRNVGIPAGKPVQALAISPNFISDLTVFAGLDGNLYRSTDGGEIWRPQDSGLTDRTIQAFAVSANYANDGTLFVGTRFSGVYRWAVKLSGPSVPPGAPSPTPALTATATPAPAVPTPTPTPKPPGGASAREMQAIAEGAQVAQAGPLRVIKWACTRVVAPNIPECAADGATLTTNAGYIDFFVEVKNTGPDVITNVLVRDDHGTPGDPTDDIFVELIPILDPLTFVITEDPTVTYFVGRDQTNTATATGYVGSGSIPGFTTTTSASDTAIVKVRNQLPYAGIKVIKTAGTAADGATYVTPPGPVEFKYEVWNIGMETLFDVTVIDDNGTPADTRDDIFIGRTLGIEPAEAVLFDKTLTLNESKTNTAITTGYYGRNLEFSVSASDTAKVEVLTTRTTARLKLVKLTADTPDGQIYNTVPGPVPFTLTVINEGSVPITGIIVIDDVKGNDDPGCKDNPETEMIDETKDDVLAGVASSLGPGQQVSFAVSVVVRPENETFEPGTVFTPLRNVACAFGTDPANGAPVGASDDALVQLVTWQSISPSNATLTDLWITSFATSPFFANDQTIFAGTAYGGLFKSSNAGTASPTWQRVNAGLEPEWAWVRSIALSPHYPDDRLIFVGTENGVFKGVEGSSGSVTWTPMSRGLLKQDVRALAISPNFHIDNALFAGVWEGDLYRFQNGGADPAWAPQRKVLNGLWTWDVDLTQDGVLLAGTWGRGITRNVLPSAVGWEYLPLMGVTDAEVTAAAVSPGYCPGYTILAGTWSHGLFKSIDGGATWSKINLPSGTLPIRDLAFSPGYLQDGTIFVAIWGYGVYKSADQGSSWVAMNQGLGDTKVRALAVSPAYLADRLLYVGTEQGGVFRWDPTLNRWWAVNNGLTNPMVMDLALSPQFSVDRTLLAGTWGGGAFISRDIGENWESVSSGLASPHVRSLALSPNYAADGMAYAGTYRGAYRSSDGGRTWKLMGAAGDEVSSIDVTGFAVTSTTPRTIFASTGGRGIWQFTEVGSTAGSSGIFRQAQLIYQAFLPMISKSRPSGSCP